MQYEALYFPAEDHHSTSDVYRIRQEPHGSASRFHSWTADVKNQRETKEGQRGEIIPVHQIDLHR